MAPLKSGNVMVLVALTVITVLGIISMTPQENGFIPNHMTGYLPYGELGDSVQVNPREDLYFDDFIVGEQAQDQPVIDDATLQRFIQVYIEKINTGNVNKGISIEDQERVRNLLEGIGYDNAMQLKTVLNQEVTEDVVRKVQDILYDNLFEHELNLLHSLLAK
ncbi:hypothetical protein [Geosporobacter ferrireducens]|uniref:Uncharacterized protein n=1 Tax=Geosporobacter ferrireducens TaxID=1424294 RepID=A0A1D8GGJ8_9FIRM|nr:hypothetical protein [Geosporobacter ferrireducens]AOT70045.1 hypothetical protein Gferi_10875 [Geosporobacter ferrireducens]MTI53408.1 hypothetical protein [Geosporobacter ferrireducens]